MSNVMMNLNICVEYVKRQIEMTYDDIETIINDASNIYANNYDEYNFISNYLTKLFKNV